MFPAPDFKQDWAPGTIPQTSLKLLPTGCYAWSSRVPHFIPHFYGSPGLPDTRGSRRKLRSEDFLISFSQAHGEFSAL